MKLTETQLATIETYLLSWELQFRDFYDEMFDHFCSEIEQRMSNGTSFENALADTSYLFSEHEYKAALSDTTYGLKAYEMEWFDKHKSKNKELIINEFKRYIFNPRLLVWALACLVVYQLSVYFNQPKLGAFLMIPAVILSVITQIKLKTWRGFTWQKVFYAFDYRNAGVHKSKDTLFAKPHTFLHNTNKIMFVLTMCLNTIHLFNGTGEIPFLFYTVFGVLFFVTVIIINSVANEVIRQEKVREKTLLFYMR